MSRTALRTALALLILATPCTWGASTDLEAPPSSSTSSALTGLHLSANDAKVLFGPNQECVLEFKPGPPPYLQSSCAINAAPPFPASPPPPPTPVSPSPSPPPARPLPFVTAYTAVVTTIAGDGTEQELDGIGTSARFTHMGSIWMTTSPDGQMAYVSSESTHKIRQVNLTSGEVSTLVGSSNQHLDGVGSSARLRNPKGLDVTPDGSALIFCDNDRIRKLEFVTMAVTSFSSATSLSDCWGLKVTPDGTRAIVTRRRNSGRQVWSVDITQSSGPKTLLKGNPPFSDPFGLAVTPDGSTILVCNTNGMLYRLSLADSSVDEGTYIGWSNEYGGFDIAVTADGARALITDGSGGKLHGVYSVDLQTNIVTKMIGDTSSGFADGTGSEARFSSPAGISLLPDGRSFVVMDTVNKRLRLVHEP